LRGCWSANRGHVGNFGVRTALMFGSFRTAAGNDSPRLPLKLGFGWWLRIPRGKQRTKKFASQNKLWLILSFIFSPLCDPCKLETWNPKSSYSNFGVVRYKKTGQPHIRNILHTQGSEKGRTSKGEL